MKQRWMTPYKSRRKRIAPSYLKNGKSRAMQESGKQRITIMVNRDNNYNEFEHMLVLDIARL